MFFCLLWFRITSLREIHALWKINLASICDTKHWIYGYHEITSHISSPNPPNKWANFILISSALLVNEVILENKSMFIAFAQQLLSFSFAHFHFWKEWKCKNLKNGHTHLLPPSMFVGLFLALLSCLKLSRSFNL